MLDGVNMVRTLDSKLNRDSSLSHLRRFAKHNQLPVTLQSTIPKNEHSQTIFVLISPPMPDLDTLQDLLAPFGPVPAPTPAAESESEAQSQAAKTQPAKITFYPLRVPLLPPLNPHQAEKWTKTMWPVIFNPASPRANIAPPPQILNRTLDSVQEKAGYYLALSQVMAHEAEQSGLGRGVGAVIVDSAIDTGLHDLDHRDNDSSSTEWARAVVAVAGDARYINRGVMEHESTRTESKSGRNPASQTYNADLEGGPELHALMRAVDMVARRRREDESSSPETSSSSSPDKGAYLHPLESFFLYQADAPAAEEDIADADADSDANVVEKYQKTSSTTRRPSKSQSQSQCTSRIRPRTLGGYLCTDMDVYLSHEPCLCCSMGVLLSRFRAVIFPRGGRMVTGGLASEPAIAPVSSTDGDGHEEGGHGDGTDESRKYYGLHWRKELNWRALGFEFVEQGWQEQRQEQRRGQGQGQEPAFHA